MRFSSRSLILAATAMVAVWLIGDGLAGHAAAQAPARPPTAGEYFKNVTTSTLKGLTPNMRVAKDRYGLSVALSSDDRHAVVAGVEDKSPAKEAGITKGMQITSVNGQPVTSYTDRKPTNGPYEVVGRR